MVFTEKEKQGDARREHHLAVNLRCIPISRQAAFYQTVC